MPLFLSEETSRPTPIRKVQMERNKGMRPGAELQPPGLGICKDQSATPMLKAIRRIELMKSIAARASSGESCRLST
jgi:hypothetical protein